MKDTYRIQNYIFMVLFSLVIISDFIFYKLSITIIFVFIIYIALLISVFNSEFNNELWLDFLNDISHIIKLIQKIGNKNEK